MLLNALRAGVLDCNGSDQCFTDDCSYNPTNESVIQRAVKCLDTLLPCLLASVRPHCGSPAPASGGGRQSQRLRQKAQR
ncbi:hypothetical protein J4Q44_G00107210 [Coregonus suidteri]|uniref:Uncharacterized protein n=1 Tax=Coregonus suidteri TaxID=861788 RepID=A0AAN8M7W2_9TELE